MKLKQAIVNGEPIAREAVQFELDRLIQFYTSHGMSQADVRKNLDTFVEKAQAQAIGAKLLFERASQLDIPVPEQMVDAKLMQVIQQLGGRDNFVKALAEQKTSEDDFRENLKKGCRVDILIQQAVGEVPEPTEEQIVETYEANKEKFVRPEQVLCQHILVKTEGMDAADKAQALEKIKDIRKKILSSGDAGEIGQAFSKAAAEHSDCPSGRDGGSLGWFGRGMMVPEFDKASFEMKCGEISDVIETQFGYHIILKTDQNDGGQLSLVDVHDQLRDQLRHEMRGRALDAFVNELREKATIEYR